jgi:transcriptional regulator with XRE-family HTH domain
MSNSLKKFKSKALRRPGVKAVYDALEDEFQFLDEILKARLETGLTQSEVAARCGTTQSAIARLESGARRHSPSIATLQRFARALGYGLELKLVKKSRAEGQTSHGR